VLPTWICASKFDTPGGLLGADLLALACGGRVSCEACGYPGPLHLPEGDMLRCPTELEAGDAARCPACGQLNIEAVRCQACGSHF